MNVNRNKKNTTPNYCNRNATMGAKINLYTNCLYNKKAAINFTS